MMKTWKKLTGIVLAVCIMFTVLLVPDMEPAAKAKLSSQNVSVIVGNTYNNSVRVTYSKEGHKIKNLKSNSSNLLVKQTHQRWYRNESDNYAEIEMYAKKAGKYKVTFQVCNDKNKVVSKHTINVTAATTYTSPVKNATFAGKSTYSYYGNIVSKKSGKFKVTMNKGFKLKSITMRTYDAQGKSVEKKIKNNANITLGEYAYKNEEYNEYSYDNDNRWNYYYYTHMMAETYIEIQYQNTKTKETGTAGYVLYRMPKN